MKAVLISINPPYTSEILFGEKKMEFRRVIIKALQDENLPILIYETKRKGGRGKVVALVRHHKILEPRYLAPRDDEKDCNERFKTIMYCCIDYGLWKNMIVNDEVLHSKDFNECLEQIGQTSFNYNYAIHLEDVQPLYIKLDSLNIKRPPQNMMQVEYNRNDA